MPEVTFKLLTIVNYRISSSVNIFIRSLQLKKSYNSEVLSGSEIADVNYIVFDWEEKENSKIISHKSLTSDMKASGRSIIYTCLPK